MLINTLNIKELVLFYNSILIYYVNVTQVSLNWNWVLGGIRVFEELIEQ